MAKSLGILWVFEHLCAHAVKFVSRGYSTKLPRTTEPHPLLHLSPSVCQRAGARTRSHECCYN